MQAEQRQRVHAPAGQVGRQDRRVGERVAVDLARQRVGQGPGRRRGVGRLELGVALVDVERAREGPRRVVPAAQAGQPVEHHVDLHLRALGRRVRRRGPPRSRSSTAGATPARTWAAATDRVGSVVGGSATSAVAAVGLHADDLGAGDQVGARVPGGPLQLARSPRPCRPTGTRHSPVPLPTTW